VVVFRIQCQALAQPKIHAVAVHQRKHHQLMLKWHVRMLMVKQQQSSNHMKQSFHVAVQLVVNKKKETFQIFILYPFFFEFNKIKMQLIH